MPTFTRILSAILLAVIWLVPHESHACDRSSLTLDSLIFNGNNSYTVHLTLCVGGGILGSNSGAMGATGLIGLAAYGNQATFVSFSPDTLISDTLGCEFEGQIFNVPTAPPFLSGTTDSAYSYVLYSGIDISCPWFACISSTIQCGYPSTQCESLTLDLVGLPDSITAIGIEGAGNPSLGCHRDLVPGYDSDINVEFSPMVATVNAHQVGWYSFYPSPTRSETKAEFFWPVSESISCSLTDLTGHAASLPPIITRAGLNRTVIDLSPFSAGIYFLTLQGESGTLSRKLVRMP